MREQPLAGIDRGGGVALVPETVQPRRYSGVRESIERRQRIRADDPRQVEPIQFPARWREFLDTRPVAARRTVAIANGAERPRPFEGDDRRVGAGSRSTAQVDERRIKGATGSQVSRPDQQRVRVRRRTVDQFGEGRDLVVAQRAIPTGKRECHQEIARGTKVVIELQRFPQGPPDGIQMFLGGLEAGRRRFDPFPAGHHGEASCLYKPCPAPARVIPHQGGPGQCEFHVGTAAAQLSSPDQEECAAQVAGFSRDRPCNAAELIQLAGACGLLNGVIPGGEHGAIGKRLGA
ncbi:MAG TPA: hypothetical protein VFE12_12720 [Acetobacteraceae bacterium]|nr:hypothetical protein [Acetobacteraceae bacterium]